MIVIGVAILLLMFVAVLSAGANHRTCCCGATGCSCAACISEAACPSCPGDTPTHYKVQFADLTPRSTCLDASIGTASGRVDTLSLGTVTLTQDGTNPCLWAGSVGSQSISVWDGTGCSGTQTTYTTVNVVAYRLAGGAHFVQAYAGPGAGGNNINLFLGWAFGQSECCRCFTVSNVIDTPTVSEAGGVIRAALATGGTASLVPCVDGEFPPPPPPDPGPEDCEDEIGLIEDLPMEARLYSDATLASGCTCEVMTFWPGAPAITLSSTTATTATFEEVLDTGSCDIGSGVVDTRIVGFAYYDCTAGTWDFGYRNEYWDDINEVWITIGGPYAVYDEPGDWTGTGFNSVTLECAGGPQCFDECGGTINAGVTTEPE